MLFREQYYVKVFDMKEHRIFRESKKGYSAGMEMRSLAG